MCILTEGPHLIQEMATLRLTSPASKVISCYAHALKTEWCWFTSQSEPSFVAPVQDSQLKMVQQK